MTVTAGLIVKPGRVKAPVLFKKYYDDNWERIVPMWVLAYRKKMPLQVKLCQHYFNTVY